MLTEVLCGMPAEGGRDISSFSNVRVGLGLVQARHFLLNLLTAQQLQKTKEKKKSAEDRPGSDQSISLK